jgi:hypothetical protein
MIGWGSMSAASYPVSLCSTVLPTANRQHLTWVGLSALAQPRLTKGGQPYLETENHELKGKPETG